MTTTGSATDLRGLDGLRTRFRGALLRPGEEGYDEVRRVWNGAIDRRPALIARCAGADDVVEAVRFARDRDLTVAVRGGGHSIAGYGVCDNGLMIDLSLMKAVRVDPAAHTARAAGGLIWRELDAATQQFGLATTGGIIGHTGIGGLTLGGGLGMLMRKHGFTVDNLLSVDLVTADGERVRADADSEPELFWALRGGGGNFGIATAFEYRLHPVGPLVFGGPILWPIEDAPAVLRFLRDFAPAAPDELGITFSITLAQPIPSLPRERYGTPVLGLTLVWAGDMDDGERVTAPLRQIGTPIVDAVSPVPYAAVQSMFDGGVPHGRHYYWKSHRLANLTDETIGILMDMITSPTAPFAQITGYVIGGAASRVGADDTAVGEREVGFDVNPTAAWPAANPDAEQHKAWVRRGWEALRPQSTGIFTNFFSDDGVAGIEAAYGGRLVRLTAVKDRYDPTNFFRLNANIPPSREAARRGEAGDSDQSAGGRGDRLM